MISHIGVHKLYYDTRALFSRTNLQIYDKDKIEQVKVILLYKYTMDSNTLLFYPTLPEIGHSRFRLKFHLCIDQLLAHSSKYGI